MTKLLPTRHLLSIAAISFVIAIALIAFPTEEENTSGAISLETNFAIVEQSQLTLADLPTPKTQPSLQFQIPTNVTAKGLPYELDSPLANKKSLQLSNAQSAQTTPLAPTENQTIIEEQRPSFREQSATVVSGDSLSKILSSHGISANDIYKVSQADKSHRSLLRMRPGQTLDFKTDNHSGELTSLTLTLNRLESVVFQRNDQQFDREEVTRTPEIAQTYKEATINNSLFVDGMRAGISQAMLIGLANIFGWDIDFALDIRKGDSLSILFEEKFLDGEKIGEGNILAAQFINNGRTFQAIRYKTARGSSYYTPDGLAMRKAFIRTPVDFTRISSKFNPNRLHPIFKTSRPHRGVDYATSSGTPVKAAGDGKISFAGKQNGYGNVVIIDHGKGYQTLYAHLKGFARGTKRGNRVQQGKVIAYVGQTGWATGPHLHYEFRINGVHKNPVTVKLPNDDPMAKKDLTNYLPYAKKVMATLENSHSPAFAQKLASLSN
ncbi:peptidoglycan DD-metalloendopeptidase family protein [Marinomonas sp.]